MCVCDVDGCPWDEAASKLVSEAHTRWVQEEDGIVDDITVVVVAFSHKS